MSRLAAGINATLANGIPSKVQHSRTSFLAVRRYRHDGNFKIVVRKFEMIAEGTVGLQLNRLSGDRYLRSRIRTAVKDHLGVHVHEKSTFDRSPPARGKSAGKTAFRRQLAPTRQRKFESGPNSRTEG